ncbi:MAG TPA: OmpH family outer membrane protein [Acidobacteriota bacterium]|nr:OmpH family outer membrane protein [Acidobacteriota bacterium]
MIRIMTLMLALALALPAAPVAAAQDQAATIKVAIVDLNRLLVESALGKASQTRLQNYFEAKQNELAQEYQALQREQGSLENQRSVLSMDAYTAKRNDLEQRMLRFRQKSEEAEATFKQMQTDETQKFLNQMAPIIRAIGEEGSYTLILRRTAPAVLYYNPTVDITDQVLSRLDASAPAN